MNNELESAARIAVFDCMNLKEDESFLVITDEPCREIGYTLWSVAKQNGANAVITEIVPRKSHGEEPPDQIAEFMKNFDVVLIPTSKSLSHTNSRREASKSGVRIATLPGISVETMKRAMNADYKAVAEKSKSIAKVLTGGKSVNIKTEKGTDITLYIDGRDGHSDTGLNHSKGDFSNLPAGEGYIAPMEYKAHGRVVFDASMSGVGILNGQVIDVQVEDGYATSINGGEAASRLKEIMEPHGKEAFNVAELGIGTNDRATVSGNILEDEKALNTIHIAFGDNMSMGGNIRVPSHLDGVIYSPTVRVDDKLLVENGKLII